MSEVQNLDFLGQDTYNRLINEANEEALKTHKKDYSSYRKCSEEKWAYNIYCNSPCESKEDLIKLAGMAYAWMPRMIRMDFGAEYNWNELLIKIKEFKDGNNAVREEVVRELSNNIDNSIVAASKILHFINPEFAPIIDSRVAKGWNKFFANEIRKEKIKDLPEQWNFYSKVQPQKNRQRDEKIRQYIYYWDRLLEWKHSVNTNNPQKVTMRDLEFPFYCLGGKEK